MTISFGSYNEISMYESISDDSDFLYQRCKSAG